MRQLSWHLILGSFYSIDILDILPTRFEGNDTCILQTGKIVFGRATPRWNHCRVDTALAALENSYIPTRKLIIMASGVRRLHSEYMSNHF